jgi:Sigma-70 region 2
MKRKIDRIYLSGSETIAELMALGLSRRTAFSARKKGWYAHEYMKRHDAPTEAPTTGFGKLGDPIRFARWCVRRELNYLAETHDIYWEELDDLAQEGLLEVWANRHRSNEIGFIEFSYTTIIRVVKHRIQRDRRRRKLWLKHLYPHIGDELGIGEG